MFSVKSPFFFSSLLSPKNSLEGIGDLEIYFVKLPRLTPTELDDAPGTMPLALKPRLITIESSHWGRASA
jgi:hypothetical protein